MLWERKPSKRVLGGVKVAQGLESEDALPRTLRKALAVAHRMDQGDRLGWADVSLAVIGRNITEHRRHPETGDFLRQALSDAETLYAVLRVSVDALAAPVGLPPVEPPPGPHLGVASLHQG